MGWEVWQNLQTHGSLAGHYNLLDNKYGELSHYLEGRFESHQHSQGISRKTSPYLTRATCTAGTTSIEGIFVLQEITSCCWCAFLLSRLRLIFFFLFGLVLEHHLPTVSHHNQRSLKKIKFHICLFARLLQKISNSRMQNPEELCVRRRSNKIHIEFGIQASAFFTFPKRGNKAAVAAQWVGVPFQSYMQGD